jgi:hypothetical protein
MTPVAVDAPNIVMLATYESPSIRPLPSHATPENVSRAASTPNSLDFDSTDSLMNSSDGVTERHVPANVLADGAFTTVSGDVASGSGFVELEHASVAHSTTGTDIQRFILPPRSASFIIPAELDTRHNPGQVARRPPPSVRHPFPGSVLGGRTTSYSDSFELGRIVTLLMRSSFGYSASMYLLDSR